MNDLFAPSPTENLLPFDGQLYNLGQLDLIEIADSVNDLYQLLLTTLPWQSDIVTLFGKTHVTKRKVVWMADEGLSYRYGGHTHLATGWHPLVFHVKQLIEDKIHTLKLDAAKISSANTNSHQNSENEQPYFNACLLNYYPSGSEGMSYHADDEKELGAQPLIAAFSLGATREMSFKHKQVKHKLNTHKNMLDKVDLYLTSGQLIVMAGVTQHYWKHSIAKTTKVNEGRISLTFRHMLTV